MGYFTLFIIIGAITAFFILPNSKAGHTPKQSHLYQKLLRKAMGDQAQVERLIELERKRHPTASRNQLIHYAIDRWEHHNR